MAVPAHAVMNDSKDSEMGVIQEDHDNSKVLYTD